QHRRQPGRHAVLRISDDHHERAGDTLYVRPGRRRHADRPDAATRPDHKVVPHGNQGAAERVASQYLQRLGNGEPRVHRSHSVGADHHHGVIAMTIHTHDRGVALVLSIFLMTALSVLAASLMFLSQTETYASMNYRMMSQARYAGESAL